MKSRNTYKKNYRHSQALKLIVFALMLVFTNNQIFAQLPTGGQVFSGNAVISQNENTLNIQQQSNNLGVRWQTFNIGAGKTVNFNQPNQDSIAYNHVIGNTRSEIYGTLNANGKVFFSNPSGFIFSPSSVVNVGSIVASTRKLNEDDFIKGNYNFSGDSNAELIFQGNLKSENGNVVLIANKVKNTGNIIANQGKVVLAAADTVDISLDHDSRINVRLGRASIDALVENRGLIAADGGQVVLTARGREMATKDAIWNLGTLRAKSLEVKNGEVILDSGNSSDSGAIQVAGNIDVSGVKGGNINITGEKIVVNHANFDASGSKGGGTVLIGGDWQGQGVLAHAKEVSVDQESIINVSATDQGSGGKVVLWSTEKTSFAGTIEANATGQGDGGQVETSSKKVLAVNGQVTAKAVNGKNGQWLLDPTDLWIVDDGVTSSPTGSSVTNTSIQNTLNTGTDVTLTTASANTDQGDVVILANINKTAGAAATLSINAEKRIGINAGVNISSTSNQLNLNLTAAESVELVKQANIAAISINNNGGTTTINAGTDINIANTNFTNSNSVNLNSTGGNVILDGVSANVSSAFNATASAATNSTVGNVAIVDNLTSIGSGQLILSAGNNLDLGQKIINSSGDIVLVAGNGTASGTTAGGTVSNITGSSIITATGKSINISSAGSSTDNSLAEQLRLISQIGGGTVTTGTLNYNTAASISNKGTAPLNIYLRDEAMVTLAAARKYDGTTDIKSTDITSKTLANGSKDDRIVEDGSVVVQIDNKNAGSRGISSVKVINDYFTGGVNGYSVADTSSATITPRDVTITAVNKDKVYDGSTGSNGLVTISGDGFVTDEATITQSYSDKNVAAGAQIINPNYELAATTVEGNYVVTKVSATGNITAKALTATASNDSKVYDGTNTSTGTVVFSGFVTGESGTASQQFDGIHVNNTSKTSVINVSSGANTDLANYSLTLQDGVGTITKRAVTVTAGNDSKVYDGTTTANTGAVSFSNFIASDGASATQSFDNKNVASASKTIVGDISFSNSDAQLNDYLITKIDGSGTITAKALTATASNDSKVYDGTNTSTGTVVFSGFVTGESGTASQQFDGIHVNNTSKTNVINVASGANTDLANYSLTLQDGVGTITKRAVTVTAGNDSKVYDGTTNANTGAVSFSNFIASDGASATQSFDNKNVASASKAVVGEITFANSAAQLNDYLITKIDGSGTITAKALTATASNDSKVYDGTNTSTGTVVFSGFVTGESGTASQQFDGIHVNNTSKTSVINVASGANTDLANYSLTLQDGVGTITKRAVMVTAGNDSKVYDGTTNANTGTVSFSNFIASDGAMATQVFNDSHVKTTNKTIISQFGFSNSNARASDYDVSLVEGTGQITPRQVNIIATNYSKTYDGTNVSASLPIVENLLDGDSLNDLKQSYDNEKVGTNKTITPSFSGLSSEKYFSEQSDYDFKVQPNNSAMIVENPNVVKQNTTTAISDTTTTPNNSETDIKVNPAEIVSPAQLLAARAQLYSAALQALDENPSLATVQDCSTSLENCIATPLKMNTSFGEPRIKNRIALMIGIDDYNSPIPDLTTPTNDIREVGASLNRNYGYEVKQLRNATKKSILSALNDLILNTDPQDSIVLMYAGHGIQKKGKAYWIPNDATFDKPDNWIDHDDINKALSRIPSRQILLISDSCYSGALTKEFQVDTSKLNDQREILLRRSVMVMSSGNIEPVADDGAAGHSIFANSLINSINTGANLRYGSQVFQEISQKVEKATGQSPQYGAAVSAGYMQGGEFIFAPEEITNSSEANNNS